MPNPQVEIIDTVGAASQKLNEEEQPSLFFLFCFKLKKGDKSDCKPCL